MHSRMKITVAEQEKSMNKLRWVNVGYSKLVKPSLEVRDRQLDLFLSHGQLEPLFNTF
jgi:hypothetical protein